MVKGWVQLMITACHEVACLRFLTVRFQTTWLCHIW